MAGENVHGADRAPGVLRGARSRRARRPRRRAVGAATAVRRQVTEITAVVPALSDDTRASPSSSARRSAGRSSGPARCRRGWRGASTACLPPGRRCGRSSKVTERERARDARRRALHRPLLRARGGLPDGDRAPVRAPAAAAVAEVGSRQLWLHQAGVALTPTPVRRRLGARGAGDGRGRHAAHRAPLVASFPASPSPPSRVRTSPVAARPGCARCRRRGPTASATCWRRWPPAAR